MTYKELIDAVAESCDCEKKEAKKVCDALFDAVATGLADDGDVQITGFGNFYLRKLKARDGRNPATGEKIRIAALQVPAFKAYPKLKKRFRDDK